jgi:hypothetical protein
MNSDGETSLKVPQAAAGRKMRAVLHARNAQGDTVASIGVTVLPGDLATDVAAQPTLKLSTQNASPGDVISVIIEGNHGDARITLNDGTGTSIEQGNMLAGESAIVLTAPNTTTPKTYYVIANVTQGVGEQMLVKKLTVTPR